MDTPTLLKNCFPKATDEQLVKIATAILEVKETLTPETIKKGEEHHACSTAQALLIVQNSWKTFTADDEPASVVAAAVGVVENVKSTFFGIVDSAVNAGKEAIAKGKMEKEAVKTVKQTVSGSGPIHIPNIL